jgi:hypothetical protein
VAVAAAPADASEPVAKAAKAEKAPKTPV